MMHEPYYKSGVFTNENLNISAGWVSIKNSFADCMPVVNRNKDLILIYAGENFVDAENNIDFNDKAKGAPSTNAQYLIDQYEAQGENFVANLNGWFSGILIDLQKGRVLIFNDRYGLNRIYCHRNKDELLFASEAKALLKVRRELRQIDKHSLGEYFAFGCVLNPKTLFNKVEVLPGGSLWVWEKSGKLKKNKYFKPHDWERQEALHGSTFYAQLKSTFEKILPRYFHSCQQVGISLTGGLDTRAILSYRHIRAGSIPCYTFGGLYRDCHDVKIAKRIANLLGQSHTILQLDENFFRNFANLAEKTIYISDGCHDLCGAHDLYFSKLARKIAPIRLTGKFGSEVLRGASTFRALKLDKRLFDEELNRYIERVEDIYKKKTLGEKLTFTCFEDIPNHEYGRLSVEQSQLGFRTPYMDNDLIKLLFRAPQRLKNDKAITLRLIHDLNPELLDIPTDLGFSRDQTIYAKLIRFNRWLSFKAEWYFNEGMPHWLSRLTTHGLSSFEQRILGTHKIEHYRKWLKEKLAGYIRSVLLDEKTQQRPFFNGPYLEKITEQHLLGKGNFIKEINKAVTIELIYRQLIE